MLQVSNLMQENAKLKKQVEEKEEKEKQFMEERRDLLLKHRKQEKALDDKTPDSTAVQKKPDERQVQRGSSKRAFGLVNSGEEKPNESLKVHSFFWVLLLRLAEANCFTHYSSISRNTFCCNPTG